MDEKEIDLKIEKEMVDLFIISNRKERTLWELESPRKRSDGLSRFFFGTYLNQNLWRDFLNFPYFTGTTANTFCSICCLFSKCRHLNIAPARMTVL